MKKFFNELFSKKDVEEVDNSACDGVVQVRKKMSALQEIARMFVDEDTLVELHCFEETSRLTLGRGDSVYGKDFLSKSNVVSLNRVQDCFCYDFYHSHINFSLQEMANDLYKEFAHFIEKLLSPENNFPLEVDESQEEIDKENQECLDSFKKTPEKLRAVGFVIEEIKPNIS